MTGATKFHIHKGIEDMLVRDTRQGSAPSCDRILNTPALSTVTNSGGAVCI
jgi:hypothetical protein